MVEKVIKNASLDDICPFIHLGYVVSSGIMEYGKVFPRKVINASICIYPLTCFCLSTGIPVVQSFTDASYLDVDPVSAKIQQLEIRMMIA